MRRADWGCFLLRSAASSARKQVIKEIACFRNDTIGAFVAGTKTGISAPLTILGYRIA